MLKSNKAAVFHTNLMGDSYMTFSINRFAMKGIFKYAYTYMALYLCRHVAYIPFNLLVLILFLIGFCVRKTQYSPTKRTQNKYRPN